MNRRPQPAGTRRRHRRSTLADVDPLPLAVLTIRFGDGQRVEVHCHPSPGGRLAVHTTRLDGTPDQHDWAQVIRLAAAGFLTTTGRRGTAAGTIYTHGRLDLDSAVTVADSLDLLAAAALAAAGITDPETAHAILAALWATP